MQNKILKLVWGELKDRICCILLHHIQDISSLQYVHHSNGIFGMHVVYEESASAAIFA